MKEFFASNRLSAYIDGELSSAEMAEMDRAMKANPQLQQEYERLLATVEFVRQAGPVQAPPDFHSKVLQHVASEPMPGGFWRRVKTFFAGIPMETVAVAMAAVLVTIVIGQRMDDAPEDTPPDAAPLVEESPELAAAPEGEAKTDTAVKEVADLIQRGTEPVQQAKQEVRNKDIVTLGTGGGAGINPEQIKDVITTAAGSQDGVAALVDEPTVGDAPEKSYADGDIGQVLTSAMSYRLHVDDDRALRNLARVAAKHGGAAYVNGQPVDESFRFDKTNTRAQVAIQIPSGNLSGFYQDLAALGEVEQMSEDNSKLYSTDKLAVSVDVMYSP